MKNLRVIIRRILSAVVLTITLLCLSDGAFALSLDLDSVATWGKFPRFCVNTYRWGDKFFNSYDSTYVEGTGYKFNGKFRTETWADNYIFNMEDDYQLKFTSDYCTSAGLWLTYLALSVGYDVNVSKWVGGSDTSRKRFTFGFNCALFAADLYWITNDVGTTLTSYGPDDNRKHCSERFTGINTKIFGVDAYYFFNNKKYSRAAAFNFSKVQKKSQGSWFIGLSYWTQDFDFDFNQLPEYVKADMPESLLSKGLIYHNVNHNYSFRGGYGYNWVFARHWLLGVSESPLIGIKHGRLNGESPTISCSLYNRAQLSCVWNNRAWFAGIIFSVESGFIIGQKEVLANNIFTGQACLGYRFNLW